MQQACQGAKRTATHNQSSPGRLECLPDFDTIARQNPTPSPVKAASEYRPYHEEGQPVVLTRRPGGSCPP
jgi:hypothetical protein